MGDRLRSRGALVVRRVAWLTDIHLDYLDLERARRYFNYVRRYGPNLVLISGDIGEGSKIEEYLGQLEQGLKRPVYFVLGNHDYFFSSITEVRRRVRQYCSGSKYLRWLTACELVPLSANTALIGHDGWADGRYGDFFNSKARVLDYDAIEELSGLNQQMQLARIRALAAEAVRHVAQVLPQALDRYRNVIFLTHVPPYRNAAWHRGKPSDDDYAPHFSCRIMGEKLTEIMRSYPDRMLTVLCGHTHGSGELHCLLVGEVPRQRRAAGRA